MERTNRIRFAVESVLDTASLPAYVDLEGFPLPTAGEIMREAIDYIGSHKVMWGTDVPALLPFATYNRLPNAAQIQTELLAGFCLCGPCWLKYESTVPRTLSAGEQHFGAYTLQRGMMPDYEPGNASVEDQ